MSEFQNLVAIVAGGASGIGAAVASRLAAFGAQVAVLDVNTTTGTSIAVDGGMQELRLRSE
ncbi:SDR family NAD(P)-dependent oxidoreductase [Salinibacterium metalliresistens]|uniref:SDR family NAD(P)-dependent oxidoreductase n=1 Tax=Salinibacterium metalliresistens TaxID=3031321 RepID=UPI003B834E34